MTAAQVRVLDPDARTEARICLYLNLGSGRHDLIYAGERNSPPCNALLTGILLFEDRRMSHPHGAQGRTQAYDPVHIYGETQTQFERISTKTNGRYR